MNVCYAQPRALSCPLMSSASRFGSRPVPITQSFLREVHSASSDKELLGFEPVHRLPLQQPALADDAEEDLLK